MKEFSIAVLKYNNADRLTYQVCAEFLRLSGIWIWEQLTAIENSISEIDLENEPDIFVYDISELRNQIRKEKYLVYDVTIQKNIITGLGMAWRDKGFILEVNKILEVFLKYNLFTASLTLQYFRKENNYLVEKAGKYFEEAAKEFDEILKREKVKPKHLWYAKLYCWQKANLAADLCDNQIPMFVDVLSDECDALLDQYKNFHNVHVLIGMVNDIVSDEVEKSINEYNMAANRMSRDNGITYPILASIYYWIGKRCEGYNTAVSIMKKAYDMAYKASKYKYRIIYKKAIMSIYDEQYEKAVRYFEECIECLNKKNNYWDPLEQEYYFKTKIQIAYYRLIKFKEPESCIINLNDAFELYDKLEQGRKSDLKNVYTAIYWDIFGEEKDAYLDEELKRMNRNQAYIYYAKACEDLNEFDEAQKWWEKVQIEK